MNEEAAFIAALAADPSDRTAALVFADWLDERGDLRGAMLRIAEVRDWMAPTYANPLPSLRAAVETGKGILEASRILALIGEAAVPELVPLLTHEKPLVRLRAVKALGLMGTKAKAAIPALMEMVKGTNQEDTRARKEAVKLLGVMRAKQSVKDELAKGLDSSDAAERLAAVEAMAKLRTTTAASSLCKVLADESDAVRRAAAQQLRYITGPTTTFAVEPLRKALADPDAIVRSMSVVALGKIGPKAAAAVPDLLRLLNETAVAERRPLLVALAQIGIGIPEVLEVILAALRDPDTREMACNMLAQWPSLPVSAAPAILEIVRNPNSGSVYWDTLLVRSGLLALTRIVPPPPEVLEEFRTQLAKSEVSVAAQALGEIGPPAAALLPELLAALDRRRDPYTIAKAIGKIGGEGITALVQVLEREPNEHEHLLGAAVAGLKEAGPAAVSALPMLLACLRRKNNPSGQVIVVNAIVVDAIAAMGPDAAVAVPDLVARLLEGDCKDREIESLTAALRGFGSAVLPFVPQLTETLRQPARAGNHVRIIELLTGLIPHGFDAFPVFRAVLRQATANDFYEGDGYLNYYRRVEVASAAIAGLAALGTAAEDAIPDLVLADQTFASSNLRLKVLAAYGAIGGAAVPHIRAALADRNRDVRLAAIEALTTSGDASAESQDALRKAETDTVRIVRARAIAALRKMGTRKGKRG